ncbi:hypothetical protein ABH935_004169 [Catenulispora sp. GAS73]|uniref:replication-relaxation family protein n=1 Tax=Catenulispora sp. GAS73 TaxID=3156269 RepID=UPI0035192348
MTTPAVPITKKKQARKGAVSRRSRLAAFSRITDRDRQLLVLLAKHQVLTTHQITRALIPCPRVARHRLEVLEDVGLIDVFRPTLPAGSSPKHAVLTPLGAMAVVGLVDAQHAAPVTSDSVVRLAARLDLRHLLGVNDVFCSLTAAARDSADGELELWWSERACTRTWGALVRPDGFGRWRESGRSVDFFLEYDTGTEPQSKVVAKLDGYAALQAATGRTSPVLFWLHSPKRESELHGRLTAANPKVPVATATGDAATVDPSGPVWRIACSGGRARLIDLDRLVTAS